MKLLKYSVPATALVALALAHCGGSSSSSDGYKSVKGAEKANLSASEKNSVAAPTNSGSAVGSGTGSTFKSQLNSTSLMQAFSRGYSTAMGAEGNTPKKFSATQSFSTQCNKDGGVEMGLTLSGEANGNEDNVTGNMSVQNQFKFTNCAEDDGIATGGLSLAMRVDFNISPKTEKGNMTMAMDLSGSISGEGKNESGTLEKHAIAFKDFSLRMELDEKSMDAISKSSKDDEEKLVAEYLTCKGTVTIDAKEIPCESFMALTLEDEAFKVSENMEGKRLSSSSGSSSTTKPLKTPASNSGETDNSNENDRSDDNEGTDGNPFNPSDLDIFSGSDT